MRHFWQSNTGKLMAGGCGAQISLIITFSFFAITLIFCFSCALTNGVSFMFAPQEQENVAAYSAPPVPAEAIVISAGPSELASLLQEVDVLLGEVEVLQKPPVMAVAPATPAAPLPAPVAMANQSGVILYSGPAENYKRIGELPLGESREVIGRNGDSTWWIISMPNGGYAWIARANVATFNIHPSLPIVSTPAELARLVTSGAILPTPTFTPTATLTPTPFFPPGTPTPGTEAERKYVEDLLSYQKVSTHLLVPPVSAGFSPDGTQIAMTERIKVYTFMTDGGHTDIWFEDDDRMGPLGNVVWSPDGQYIAFDMGFKWNKYCHPCQGVALLRPADGTVTIIPPPEEGLDTSAPRWTQDGHLLIIAHKGEPADGVAYVYNIHGDSKKAEGVYLLSSSHQGQKWYPWLPGRIWRADVSERADSYNSD